MPGDIWGALAYLISGALVVLLSRYLLGIADWRDDWAWLMRSPVAQSEPDGWQHIEIVE